MKQPIRRKHKTNDERYSWHGDGIDSCNDCPFISIYPDREFAICNAWNLEFYYKEGVPIKIPDICGNQKEK